MGRDGGGGGEGGEAERRGKEIGAYTFFSFLKWSFKITCAN